MSKAKKRPFRQWEGKFADDKYIRLTDHMYTFPAFLKLSSGAKVLYSYMKLHAGMSESVRYAAIMAKDFMGKNAYFRARDELIDAKFIYWTNKPMSSNGKIVDAKHEAAVFEFSDEWWTGRPHRPEPLIEVIIEAPKRNRQRYRNATVMPEMQGSDEPVKEPLTVSKCNRKNCETDCGTAESENLATY